MSAQAPNSGAGSRDGTSAGNSNGVVMPKLVAPSSMCEPHIYNLYTRLNRDEKVNQGAHKAGAFLCLMIALLAAGRAASLHRRSAGAGGTYAPAVRVW